MLALPFQILLAFPLITCSSSLQPGQYLTLQRCGEYPEYQEFIQISSSLHLYLYNDSCFDCYGHCQGDPHQGYCYCGVGGMPFIQNCDDSNNNGYQTYQFMKISNYTIIQQTDNNNKTACFGTLSSEIYGMTQFKECDYSNPSIQWIFDFPSKYYITSILNTSLCLTAAYYPSRNCTISPFNNYAYCNQQLPVKQRVNDLIQRMTLSEKINNLGGGNIGVPRLGITPNIWHEALHGISTQCGAIYNNNTGCPTSFPIPLLLGATFNRSLWREIGKIISNEGRALYNQGVAGLFYLAPNINMFRDPRWGRGQEVPGEDPYLTGQYGIEYVKSIQFGEDTRYLKLALVAKHFADYDVEGNIAPSIPRKSFNAIVSDKDQVEYYWVPWRMVIESTDLKGIMCSYNNINGIPSCGNDLFLNQIVRNEWYFNGVIFSDGGAISDDAFTQYINKRYNGSNPQQQCRVAMEGGCDVNLGGYYPLYLPSAVQQGIITETDINIAISRLFTISFILGKFDYISPPYYNRFGAEYVDTPFNRKLAMNAAEQGIVLIKNENNILPIHINNNMLNIAFIGPHFNITQYMLSSYRGVNSLVNTHSPYQAMMRYIDENELNDKISLQYVEGCDIVCNTTTGFDDAVSLAKDKDLVIVFLGLYGVQYSDEIPYGLIFDAARESEGCDRSNLTFPNYQLLLLQQLFAINNNIILVLFNSSPIDISWPKQNIKGILQCFYPGEMGGDALINILMGNVSPSAKLPITIYPEEFAKNRDIEDMGLSTNEGITYRYYTGEVVYPFGHGLYYTNFTYNHIDDDNVKKYKYINTKDMADYYRNHRKTSGFMNGNTSFVVKVTNIGNMSSDCIVLGFVTKDNKNNNGEPNIKLFDFEKVFIETGQSVNVTLSVSPYIISSVDKYGHEKIKNGLYNMFIGDYMNNNFIHFKLIINGDDDSIFDLQHIKKQSLLNRK